MSNVKALKKLLAAQIALKVGKSNYNQHGKFSYRNAEDILAALKPIQESEGFVVLFEESIIPIEGRFYVCQEVQFVDVESGETLTKKGHAREVSKADRMNEAQTTGSASSYAKKYALNNLFGISDPEDDPDHPKNNQKKANSPRQSGQKQQHQNKGSYSKQPQKPYFNLVKRGAKGTEWIKKSCDGVDRLYGEGYTPEDVLTKVRESYSVNRRDADYILNWGAVKSGTYFKKG